VNMALVVSIAAVILGAVALVLFFLRRFQRYRTRLLVLALLMFAISIGAYLSGLLGQQGESLAETPVANTPTPTQEKERPLSTSPAAPISPVSPVSPVVTPPVSISTEVISVHAELEGCLLFVSNRSGDFEIYELRESVDNRRQLTNSSGLDIEPDWSPDGKKVTFASNREKDTGFQIYVMNADGSNQKRVGDVQPGDNSHPSWSPDGSQIAFQSKRETNLDPQGNNFDIYVMDSDGGDVRQLTTHSADDSEPSWSPDGRKIAFLSEKNGQDEIYLMDSDGSNPEQITNLLVLKSGLSWSSDSRNIIFQGSGDIYVVDVETKEVTKLISDDDSNEATPAWAQNDASVVFSSDRTQNWELYVVDVSGPNKFILQQITDDPGIDRDPRWFPCTR
jgi:Tol biopolymer transport system component